MGSRMNAQNLPFEIDPDLVEAADLNFNSADQKTDSAKELFPVRSPTPCPTQKLILMSSQDYGPVLPPTPISNSERRQVQIWRGLDAKRRAGPFWTGTKDDWVKVDALDLRNASAIDPFEVAASRRGGGKRTFRMADLRTVKLGKHSSVLMGVLIVSVF